MLVQPVSLPAFHQSELIPFIHVVTLNALIVHLSLLASSVMVSAIEVITCDSANYVNNNDDGIVNDCYHN